MLTCFYIHVFPEPTAIGRCEAASLSLLHLILKVIDPVSEILSMLGQYSRKFNKNILEY